MATLPRYRRMSLRPTGAASARRAPARRLAREVVARRARGRCELCSIPWDRPGRSLHAHHAFGRGRLPGIPAEICESPELLLGLCNNDPATGHRGCHERIHSGDGELADAARLQALTRFCLRHGLELHELLDLAGPDLVDVLRHAVRLLT